MNVIGGLQSGQPLIDEALSVNPRLPGYVQWGIVFAHTIRGDYRAAVAATDNLSLPNCFWDPMLRAMALAGTGEANQGLVEQAIQLRPELVERPRELGGRIIKQPDVLDLFEDQVRSVRSSGK